MATETSPTSNVAHVWQTVSNWPPEHKRELARRLLRSLEHEDEPMAVSARIDELRRLKNGWMDGKGQAPCQTGLDTLANAFAQHYPDDLPRPYLYATPNGGVQAEWTLGENDLSLEVNLDNQHAEWQCVNLRTEEQDDRELDLNRPNEWQWIVDRIRLLQGAVS